MFVLRSSIFTQVNKTIFGTINKRGGAGDPNKDRSEDWKNNLKLTNGRMFIWYSRVLKLRNFPAV